MVTGPPFESEPEGQSDAAKAWVARREAFDKAAAAVAASQEQERAREQAQVEQRLTGGSPVVFVVGFLVVFGLLALFGWFFVLQVQCDPMISDRGLSSACRRAAP